MKAEERYELMTRAERRVAIAKDVIGQINAGVFKARDRYGYIQPTDEEDVLTCSIAKHNAIDVAKECFVCARGAMMLSRIAKFNKVVITPRFGYVEHDQTTKALRDAFTSMELEEIEWAFEGQAGGIWERFYLDHENASNRLIAICQNIIDGNGTFDPSVRYDVKYV